MAGLSSAFLPQPRVSPEEYWLDAGRMGDYSGDSAWALNLPRLRQSMPERSWPMSPLLPRVPPPINNQSRMPAINPVWDAWPWLTPRTQQGAGYAR